MCFLTALAAVYSGFVGHLGTKRLSVEPEPETSWENISPGPDIAAVNSQEPVGAGLLSGLPFTIGMAAFY